MTRRIVPALGSLVLCVASARGTSTPPVTLTPKTVGDHPHLGVAAEGTAEGVRFRVSIAGKGAKAPPEVDGGYLTVRGGDRLVCACFVRPQPLQSRAVFEFVVAGGHLEASRFSFSVATASPEERKTMPAGAGWAGYQFTLKDFAPAPGAKRGAGPPAKPRDGRYVAYWLTRDPPDPKSTEYEPLLLLARSPLEEFTDEKERLDAFLRTVNPEPPPEALEAPALTVETYQKDSIWDPDGRPFRPVRSLAGVDPKARHATVNGTRYRHDECPIREAVRLLEYPEGTIPIHRVHKPGAGPAQTQTARALLLLLKEQLAADAARAVDPRVRALVAYLERNGVTLVPDDELEVWRVGGRWRIAGPARPGAVMTVDLLAFPPMVSRTWMLDAHGIPSDPEVNARARLAMSRSISLGDPDRDKPDEVKALERKLLDLFRRYRPPTDVVAADARAAEDREALLSFLKARGVELRPARSGSNYMQHTYTIGPDHAKGLRVGLNYLPPLTAAGADERYRHNYPLPALAHGTWAVFMAGGPGGHTAEYVAAWERLEAAFKAYPGPAAATGK